MDIVIYLAIFAGAYVMGMIHGRAQIRAENS